MAIQITMATTSTIINSSSNNNSSSTMAMEMETAMGMVTEMETERSTINNLNTLWLEFYTSCRLNGEGTREIETNGRSKERK